jgi:NADH-quinone oxidoreductase subunit N
MDALILLFFTGLVVMFTAMLKKPQLVLVTSTIGIAASLGLVVRQILGSTSLITWSYQGLTFDANNLLYVALVLFLGLLIVTSGYDAFKREPEHTGEYVSLMIFSMVGALCMIGFTDMFMFFIGLEILSIPIYVLAGTNKKDLRSTEASIKYFFTGAFATGILLFGIALIFGATGSFELKSIHDAIIKSVSFGPLIYVGILFILASFLFKVGAAPFHFWSPDVYSGSPTMVTGYMAAVVKLAGMFAFMKMFNYVFVGAISFWSDLLFAVIILTMFVGNLSALGQTKFKRLLAYSSISNAAYALIAMMVASSSNMYNLWIYLAGYGFAVIVLVTIGQMVNDSEDDISSFKGIGRKYPLIGVALALAVLSLAGVPPLLGFMGKYMVFSSAFNEYPILVIIAIVNSGIGIYYYLKLLIVALSSNANDEVREIKPSALQYLVLAICGVLLVFGGVLDYVLNNLISY